jgi:hypothetical protein
VLRRACPPRDGDRAIDLMVAERLLADPVLYSQALHSMSPSLAEKPARTAPPATGAALTGAEGTLSWREHSP